MPKVAIQTIDNLQNETTALGRINANFQALQTIIDLLLSRDGTAPNQMVGILDMNNRRIINLPAPENYNDAARHGDLQKYVDAAESAQEAAEEAQEAAENAQDAAEAALLDFKKRYIGAFAEHPTVGPENTELNEGAIYYNTVQDIMYVWSVFEVFVGSDQVYVYTDIVLDSHWEPIPVNKIASMQDVDLFGIVDGQLLAWNAGLNEFRPYSLIAEDIPYDNTVESILEATDVQAALDEIAYRTTLNRYDLGFYMEGLFVGNQRLFTFVAVHPFKIPIDVAVKTFAGTPPNNDTHFILKKNGVQFATLAFSAGSPVGVLTIPGDTQFNVGDRFEVINAPNPDTAFRDVAITFSGVRT